MLRVFFFSFALGFSCVERFLFGQGKILIPNYILRPLGYFSHLLLHSSSCHRSAHDQHLHSRNAMKQSNNINIAQSQQLSRPWRNFRRPRSSDVLQLNNHKGGAVMTRRTIEQSAVNSFNVKTILFRVDNAGGT
jgi:hypothetical protein